MGKKGESRKRLARIARQEELLKNFNQAGDHYEEKKVGDTWMVKMWNGGTNRWQVAVFSEVSFRNYKSFQDVKKG